MTVNALQSVEGRYVTYPVQAGELNVVDTRWPRGFVKRYFANAGTAGVDCTVGVQRAIVAASSGAIPARPVIFDDGEFLITDECRATNHYTIIKFGDGAVVRFNPTAAKTCFRFERTSYADTAPMYGCGVINGRFVSDDSTYKKIAVDAVDVSSFKFMENWVTSWAGPKSTGLRFAGRDMARVRGNHIYAPKPYDLIANPNAPTLALDLFHFSDNETVCQDGAEYGITIANAVGMRNLLVDGDNPTAGGRGFLFWNPTSSVTTILGVDIEGVTYESPTTNGFFVIDFGGTAVVTRHFQMRRCQLGGTPATASTNKGVRLRGCYTVKLNGAYHGGNVALDVDATVHDFELDHFLILDGANATTAGLTNHTQLGATPIVGGYLLPLKAYYTNNADVASSYIRFPVILLTPGADPANLQNGMVWITAANAKARVNGATINL